jgi:hypothetical protein
MARGPIFGQFDHPSIRIKTVEEQRAVRHERAYARHGPTTIEAELD